MHACVRRYMYVCICMYACMCICMYVYVCKYWLVGVLSTAHKWKSRDDFQKSVLSFHSGIWLLGIKLGHQDYQQAPLKNPSHQE